MSRTDDMDERRRLQAEKGLLAAIVSSSDDAIVSKDLNGIVTSWNAGAESLFGWTAEETIGRHISIIAHPERAEESNEILKQIGRGERIRHYETKRRHKDGATVEISLTVSPIYDDEGRIIGASKIARDVSERRRNEERLRFLLRELDHRAKNVLAVAQAMLRLTRADTVEGYVEAIEGRIRALAQVHGQMAENRWDGAELSALVAAHVKVFSETGERIRTEGDAFWVSPAAAQVIAIVLHELSTNAAKYGALSTASGTVTVRWGRADGGLRLSWGEEGGPPVSAPERRGFGTQIIERSVPDQLGGAADVHWLPSGLQCTFIVPSAHMVEREAMRRSSAG
jgi:PAS domain S-box-containing protein